MTVELTRRVTGYFVKLTESGMSQTEYNTTIEIPSTFERHLIRVAGKHEFSVDFGITNCEAAKVTNGSLRRILLLIASSYVNKNSC